MCVLAFRYSGASESQYCCTASDACFAVDQFPSTCSDAGRAYACTGSATPAAVGLRCTPAPDAGAPGRYCCDDGDGSARGDAGTE